MKQNTVPMPTPQQQQEAQQLKQNIFDDKMKKAMFPAEHMEILVHTFNNVIPFFSIATAKISVKKLYELMAKKEGYNYLDAGFMLNCIMGTPFEKHIGKDVKEIGGFLSFLLPCVEDYEAFTKQADKDAEAETKTKLKLLNK